MDVDLSTDLNSLPDCLDAVNDSKAQIAVGSRLVPGSDVVGRSFKREFISRSYSLLFRMMFMVSFRDAQCGFKVVSKKKPSKSEFDNLIFAFNVCRYVKSNAIVLVSNNSTVGIGSGQPSRLDSCQIAIDKMKRFAKKKGEVVAASDAFFPFVDGIEKLVQAGASAVIQPGGSIRDKEVIKFANATNTVLIFSKTRHFRH